jgi:hypothetical protein
MKHSKTQFTAAWKIWTNNGAGMDDDDRFQTGKSVEDAAQNTYLDGMTDKDWLAATLARLNPPKETLYTVAHEDGEGRESNLTMREAARRILHHDGADYEIRLGDTFEKGPLAGESRFELWTRKQVANRPWSRTAISAIAKTEEIAEAAILAEVVEKSGEWRGEPIAETMDSYLSGLREMLADADDEDKPAFQAMIDEASK